jgi:phosphatidylinositol kinase/protein kinase (PI-3  family)
MGWLLHCQDVYSLMRDLWTRLERVPPDSDPETKAYSRVYYSGDAPTTPEQWACVARAFDAAEEKAWRDELELILVLSAADSNDWLVRKKNYAESLAATSIAGYVIGLGDRHPKNIMLSLPTGKLAHIDFTDIMEKLQGRSLWPEQVPCRLTPAFLRPLDVLRAQGEFKKLCVLLLEALREQAGQIVGILSVFIEDPLSVVETRSEAVNYWTQRMNVIKDKLNGIDRRLSVAWNEEECSGMSVEAHVDEIIRAATNRESLQKMWVGWRPWW